MVTNPVQPSVDATAPVQQPTRLWNRNFLLLWQGQLISRLGNQAFDIALTLWIAATFNSPTLMGVLLMVSSIPTLILAPFGGVLADRYSRRRTIILSDLLSGLVVLSLAAVLFVAPQAQALTLGWLFTVSVCLSVIGAFFSPAISATVPDLVPPKRMAGANSMGQLSAQGSQFIGQAIGGTLYTLFGAPLMFLINGLSFLFAAGSESLVAIPPQRARQPAHWRERIAMFTHDLADGLRYVQRNSGLRALVTISSFGSFFTAPILVLLPFYVKDFLLFGGAWERWYSFILAAFSVGTILGFVLVGVLSLSGRRRARAILAVMVVDALSYCALALVDRPVAALALALLAGCTGGFLTINITTLVQLTTPRELRGRVFGLLSTVAGSLTPIAMGLAGVVADLTGLNIPLIYLVSGGVLLLLAVVIAANRNIRGFLAYEEPIAPLDAVGSAATSDVEPVPPSHSD